MWHWIKQKDKINLLKFKLFNFKPTNLCDLIFKIRNRKQQ